MTNGSLRDERGKPSDKRNREILNRRKRMIETVISPRNMQQACVQVMQNKGSSGVDDMPVTALKDFVRHILIQELANLLNPKIRGWIRYMAGISSRSLKPVFYYLHHRILTWVLKKYKSF